MINAKKQEFLELRQTENVLVTDYYQTFAELIGYASELVPNERARISRFVNGLRVDIRVVVGPSHASLSLAFDQALFIERARQEAKQ